MVKANLVKFSFIVIGRNVNDYDVNIINVLYHDAAMLIFNSFIVSQ